MKDSQNGHISPYLRQVSRNTTIEVHRGHHVPSTAATINIVAHFRSCTPVGPQELNVFFAAASNAMRKGHTKLYNSVFQSDILLSNCKFVRVPFAGGAKRVNQSPWFREPFIEFLVIHVQHSFRQRQKHTIL